ncbi:hypothetical protein FRC02_005105 [Tulasnella sp. 418]|nr:hypothetical protein FRC02_005105 [Tulasnella sp. 418]
MLGTAGKVTVAAWLQGLAARNGAHISGGATQRILPPDRLVLSTARNDLCQFMDDLAIISQGIAARYVRKQASSANAAIQLDLFPVFAEIAQDILGDAYTTFIANKVPQSRM